MARPATRLQTTESEPSRVCIDAVRARRSHELYRAISLSTHAFLIKIRWRTRQRTVEIPSLVQLLARPQTPRATPSSRLSRLYSSDGPHPSLHACAPRRLRSLSNASIHANYRSRHRCRLRLFLALAVCINLSLSCCTLFHCFASCLQVLCVSIFTGGNVLCRLLRFLLVGILAIIPQVASVLVAEALALRSKGNCESEFSLGVAILHYYADLVVFKLGRVVRHFHEADVVASAGHNGAAKNCWRIRQRRGSGRECPHII